MKEFKDLKVVGIDEKVTNLKEEGSSDIHLVLCPSGNIPDEWRKLFDEAWDSYKYNVWVRAEARGKYIIIHCHHSTLHTDHMPNIERAIAKANEGYLAVHKQKVAQAERNDHAIENKKRVMDDLQSGFKKP